MVKSDSDYALLEVASSPSGASEGGDGRLGRSVLPASRIGQFMNRKRFQCLDKFSKVNRKWLYALHVATILLQTSFMLFVSYADDDKKDGIVPSDTHLAMLGAVQVCQGALLFFFLMVLLAQKFVWTTKETWMFYFSVIFSFAGFYFYLALLIDAQCMEAPQHSPLPPAFNFPPAWKIDTHGKCGIGGMTTSDVGSVFMIFVYYSVTTLTLVGFGDIAPLHYSVRMLANIEMLLGLFFAMVIVAMTLGTLRRHLNDIRDKKTMGSRLLGRRFVMRRGLIRFRHFVRRWLLVVTIIVQFSHFAILYYASPELFEKIQEQGEHYTIKGHEAWIPLLSVIVQILVLVLLLAASLKYVRHSERITLNFLCQSFLSVCIHFAGIYQMSYLFSGMRAWPDGVKSTPYWGGEFFPPFFNLFFLT